MLKAWGLTWGGWLDNRRGEWWLLAQLVLIAAHLAPPWPQPTPLESSGWQQARVLIGAIMLAVGLLLALQAFVDLRDSLSPLPAVRDELVILLGDYTRLLSRGRFRSPIHRVLLPPPGAERFSFTFFYYPSFESTIPAAAANDTAASGAKARAQRWWQSWQHALGRGRKRQASDPRRPRRSASFVATSSWIALRTSHASLPWVLGSG